MNWKAFFILIVVKVVLILLGFSVFLYAWNTGIVEYTTMAKRPLAYRDFPSFVALWWASAIWVNTYRLDNE